MPLHKQRQNTSNEAIRIGGNVVLITHSQTLFMSLSTSVVTITVIDKEFPSVFKKKNSVILWQVFQGQSNLRILWEQDLSVHNATIGSLSMQRFWATDGNRKCSVFVFKLSSQYQIYIVEYLFTSRDNYFENLRETAVLACEMFTSGCRLWLKNVACLSSLWTQFKVVLNGETLFFVTTTIVATVAEVESGSTFRETCLATDVQKVSRNRPCYTVQRLLKQVSQRRCTQVSAKSFTV